MIKNWVVKVEQIKVDSIDRHKNYLLNNKHENHLESDIKKVFYGEKFDSAFEYRKKLLAEAGKPDRSSYKNYATSFVFGPPGDFTITDEQAEQITHKIAIGVAKVLGLKTKGELAELKSHFVCVLHNEKSPKNSHFHLLISNVVNGQFRKELTQHKTKYAIQKVLDLQYKKIFDLDRASYEPEPENVGKNKPLWKARIDKYHAELNKHFTVWLNDTVKRYKKRFSNELEQPAAGKSFLSKIGNFLKFDKPEPEQIANADKVVELAIEANKTSQRKEINEFLKVIKEHEEQQKVESELVISGKIAAGIEIEQEKLERESKAAKEKIRQEHAKRPVSVGDDRTDEEKAAAKANFEKLNADLAKPKSKSYRAAAVKKAKNK